jgi:hypothetical protein
MKYSIYKKYPDGTMMWYEVEACSTQVKDGAVYFFNEGGGLEAAFKDYDAIVPNQGLKK